MHERLIRASNVAGREQVIQSEGTGTAMEID